MLAIEIRTGGLESSKDEEEIFKDALYELAKTSCNSVEAQLAEEGQVLEQLDEKLNAITGSVATLSKEVMGRLDDLQKDIAYLKEKVDGGQARPALNSEEGGQQSTLAHSSAVHSGSGGARR